MRLWAFIKSVPESKARSLMVLLLILSACVWTLAILWP